MYVEFTPYVYGVNASGNVFSFMLWGYFVKDETVSSFLKSSLSKKNPSCTSGFKLFSPKDSILSTDGYPKQPYWLW